MTIRESLEPAYAFMGQKVSICTIGIWGHRANSYECVVSGLYGRYPERTIRLTVIGNNSILPNSFNDFIVDKKDFYVGSRTFSIMIDSIEAWQHQQSRIDELTRELEEIKGKE